MSGFFLVRRDAIDVEHLHPRGFKVLLEILLAGKALTVSEVPFRFGLRHAGESKASAREAGRYLRRLVELRLQHIGRPGTSRRRGGASRRYASRGARKGFAGSSLRSS